MKTTSLFRPVNKVELDLIADLKWKAFPPRLPDQPIFYPVMNQEYASQITVEWNLPSYKNGFVTKFEVSSDYLSKFKVEKVGLDHFLELWVPAEDMDEFNSQIIGKIVVVEAYSAIDNSQYVLVDDTFEISHRGYAISVLFYPPSNGIFLSANPKINSLSLLNQVEHVLKHDENGTPFTNCLGLFLKNQEDSVKLKKGYFHLLES